MVSHALQDPTLEPEARNTHTHQQGTVTGATFDTVLTQPSTISEAVNSGEKGSGVVDPSAIATESVGESWLVAVPPPGDHVCAPMSDSGLTIPQKRGGLMDIKMASATVVSSIDQEAVNPSGGVHGIPNTPLVGTGVDSEDQTVAVESPGDNTPSMVSTGMEVVMSDEQKCQQTLPAQKRLPQTSMITPRISRHIPINDTIWRTSTPT